jgi:hypothetical protein
VVAAEIAKDAIACPVWQPFQEACSLKVNHLMQYSTVINGAVLMHLRPAISWLETSAIFLKRNRRNE